MKIVETVIRKAPSIMDGRLRASVDTDIWELVQDVDKLRRFCVDCFGEEVSDISPDSGYQLRDSDVLMRETVDVYLGFVAVPNSMYSRLTGDRNGYCVAEALYADLGPSIEHLGYDVCDDLMLSAFEHGSSPYFGGFGNFKMLNQFGLFAHYSDAMDCSAENDVAVPEHQPWNAVEIFVTSQTLRKMNALLKGEGG